MYNAYVSSLKNLIKAKHLTGLESFPY